MGCDIHLYVERRREDGAWESCDTWKASEYADEPGVMDVPYKEEFYGGRNYNLFAILADVRNGVGFAGVKTGAGFVPIAAPRGLPDDASPEFASQADRWEGDGHSHSYLTLAELLAYDWTQITTLTGCVNPVEWARFRDYGEPDGWSGMVMGGAVRHFEPTEFESAWQIIRAENEWPESRHAWAHIREGSDDREMVLRRFSEILGCESPYTRVSWDKPYYKCCKDFLGETIPRLLALGSPENVRIVFFFDN